MDNRLILTLPSFKIPLPLSGSLGLVLDFVWITNIRQQHMIRPARMSKTLVMILSVWSFVDELVFDCCVCELLCK